jgi:hypothetical protein
MPILQALSFDNDPSLMGGIGGVLNVSMFRPSNVHTMFRPIPFVFTLLRTLLRFFALTKISTLLFSSASALFGQNTGGGVSPELKEQRNFVRGEHRSGGEALGRPE